MKESKLIEMGNKLNTLAQVCERLIQENDFLKTIVMGDHQLIKKLPGFEEAFKELQVENLKEVVIHDKFTEEHKGMHAIKTEEDDE